MERQLRLEVLHAARVCYAMQQNAVPLVQLVRLWNDGKELRSVTVELRLEPELAVPWTARLASVPARRTYNLPNVDLQLRPDALANVLERQVVSLRVEARDEHGVLASCEHPVELLAYNEWPGAGTLPALLAAFVLPNHPALAAVLEDSSLRLAAATGGGALDGYQSRDPARALAIAQAIYIALGARGLAYVQPPASFEQQGQKVRTPEQVLADGMGTCLDLALLYAGCLEQVGLHALVVVSEGHAVAGFWSVPESFAGAAVEDPLPLRKRVDLGDIQLVECTGLCAGQTLPFAVAGARGARSVAVDARFLFAIDVAAARAERMRPLPVRTANYAAAVALPPAALPGVAVLAAADTAPARPALPEPVPEPVPAPAPPRAAPKPPPGRLERWQLRLLDLSLRNRLLAFTRGKKSVPLLVTDLLQWAAALGEGRAFQILEAPSAPAFAVPAAGDRGAPPVSAAVVEARAGLLGEELRNGRLRAELPAEELESRLVEIYRHARLGQEESDASTLYLALGFLRWFETPQSSQPRRAPLLLLPLQLQRSSVAEGFRVALTDDEPRVNQTLLQKLQADFGITVKGLDDQPGDDSELDIATVLAAFRRAVVDVDRFEVEAEACIGFFAFTKHLMWLDLHERAGELLQNEFLRHLVETPDQEFQQPADWPSPEQLDGSDPAELLCPKDADSSQLCAVQAAAAGRSFVLEGPPGTGKSQTITNLIAQCLADGKRVLFVAEKRAALEVVQRRLHEVGLDPFCLELHANKAGKREVVQQFGSALELGSSSAPAAWARSAAELTAARQRLNQHVQAIHRERAIGCSVFQGMAALAGLSAAPLIGGLPAVVDAADLQRRRDAVAALAAQAAPLVPLHQHAWFGIGATDWTPSLPRTLEPLLQRFDRAVAAVRAALAAALPQVGLGGLQPSRADLRGLLELCPLLLEPPPLPALLTAPDFDARVVIVTGWLDAGRAYARAWAQLQGHWQPALLDCDVDILRAQLLRWQGIWSPLRWWRQRPAKQQLQRVCTGAELPPVPALLVELEAASVARTERQRLRGASEVAAAWLGDRWQGTATDWERLAAELQRCVRLRALALALAGPAGTTEPRLQQLWSASLCPSGRTAVTAAVPALSELFAAGKALDLLLRFDRDQCFGDRTASGVLDRAAARAAGWCAALPALRDWCAFRRDADAAVQLGLSPLLEPLLLGSLGHQQLGPAFERSLYDAWLQAVCAQEPELARFRGLDHERAIAAFAAIDEQLIALAAKEVQARLGARLPVLRDTAVESSELGLLRRELKKQRRHLPVRQLLARIPNLAARLKPCFLMSPLSVAQFLGRRFPPFDVVVFDEASQIPVWDAVGAIGRARSLVVVGDARQLPPTTFFQRLEGDDGGHDDEAVEELESVLDECGAAGLQRLQLRWHYRSRHESLIAFSNHHYYDNRLLTFPAATAAAPGLGVRLVKVKGVYDRGRSQQNRIEAEALVSELVARLRDPEHSRLSYGIVTFSQSQQVLVEDLLDRARGEHPEIERHFGSGCDEPVFSKNLENVQGDERDVVLFSICYGPDAAGKVWMSFGPVNNPGGERRLNVAITRARRELLVFSSLRAEQIELARTQSLGVRHLRAFLDYAERGTAAIAEAVALDPRGDHESPFERAVCALLQQLGWNVHTQVGCSGYRIDLAVVDPRAPGRYLLGIECDGASYHSAATARDRDRLRASVLRGLGWRLCRVWSTDFWLDPQGTIARVDAELRQQLAVPLPVAAPATAQSPPEVAAVPDTDAVLDPDPEVEPDPEPEAADPDGARPYPAVRTRIQGTADEFVDPRTEPRLAASIAAVVQLESPIVFDLLARRIADAWSIHRVTEKVRERVQSLLPHGCEQDGDVVWSVDNGATRFTGFRVPEGEIGLRAVDHLPAVEIANAMVFLLRQHGSLLADDLAREAARLFGIDRLGSTVRPAMARGVDRLLARGDAVQAGERLQLG